MQPGNWHALIDDMFDVLMVADGHKSQPSFLAAQIMR